MNDNILQLVKVLMREEENAMKFLVTPSGKFRFQEVDVRILFNGTKKAHEISSVIVKTVRDVEKILNLHLELLRVCDIIYSPELITSYRAENLLLNILKLNIIHVVP